MTKASTGSFEDLGRRIGAALILAAIAAVAIWFGGGIFAIFIAIAVCLSLVELTTLVRAETDLSPVARTAMITFGGILVLVAGFLPGWTFAALIFALIALWPLNDFNFGKRSWTGFFLICLAGISAVVLRDVSTPLLLWTILAVVGVDVGGYFAGKMLGGPKLWPAVSPKKTWSGALGGLVLAIVISCVAAVWLGGAIPTAIAFATLLTLTAIGGDITESAVKRRYGVKDSGGILPGHGGLLDRFDGLIAVLCLVLVMHRAIDLPNALGLL